MSSFNDFRGNFIYDFIVLIIHVVLLLFMSPKHRWHLCVFLSCFNALMSNKYLFSPPVIIAFYGGLGKLT